VQGCIETAILSFCGEETLVYGSGRTDAGVHATGQIAHVDITLEHLSIKPLPYKMMQAINFYLDETPIRVLAVEEVDEMFHARFSALQRVYRYRIFNRPVSCPFQEKRAWWVKRKLNGGAMRDAAQHLIGTHDFNAFRSVKCNASHALRTVDFITIQDYGHNIDIEVGARSFLHNQVRITVGTLKMVGMEQWSPSKVREVLDAKDRTTSGPTAPAWGLYFKEIIYP
jgi:tRNA pseudouridine38-40 synthase